MSITTMSRRTALTWGAAAASSIPLVGCAGLPRSSTALDKHVLALSRFEDFSGTVLLARGSKVEFEGAYGLANRQKKQPNTIDTKFSLASISKMFTAVCILQLVEAGHLSLDDTIGKHLPDYPNRDAVERVTIEHLLMHRSGIGNYWEALDTLKGPRPFHHRDYIPLFANIPLSHEPGTAFAYSNGGYIVLGLIIEALTGADYFDHVERAVFDKAGMADTGNRPLEDNVPNRAIGYMRSIEHPGEWDDCTERWERRGSAAGGAYSTVGDLHRFAQALTRHELLSPAMTTAFLQGRTETPVGKYGYGVIEQSLNGRRLIGHSGGHYGVAAELMMFPDLDTTFVILSNGDVDGYWNIEMFAHQLITGPTDETRNYDYTQRIIAATVAGGTDAGLAEYRRFSNSRKAREGVVDLAAFKHIHRRQFDSGLDLLRINRAINPDSDDAIYRLAEGLRVTGRSQEAIKTYRSYLERVPDDSGAERKIVRLTQGANNAN